MEPTVVMGQPSWTVSSPTVEASVARMGGMLGPVRFRCGDRWVEPLSVGPWHSEPDAVGPNVVKALRGDFFCMPFGWAEGSYLGEEHPLHGEPANGEWQFDSGSASTLDLVFECKVRPCKVHKSVRCAERVVYQRHTVLGLEGPISFGMHAMVRFPSPGLVSLSPTVWHQTFPGQFEDPAKGGYSSLDPGAEFKDLRAAPLTAGGTTDLLLFPAREGFEDLVQAAADPVQPLAWSAVTFPEEGWVYVQLKDARVLASTVLWFSNGGRHYPPWSGRHRGVLGIEEATTYFHLGLRGSVSPNPLQSFGVKTFWEATREEPLVVSTAMGVAEVPAGFDRVRRIVPAGSGIVLVSESGERCELPLDLTHLGIP